VSDEFLIPEAGPDHPEHWYRRCLDYPEHEHLKDGQPRVTFLLRTDPQFEAGRRVLGSVHLPKVQGKLKGVFGWMLARMFGGLPDFVMILDRGFWESNGDRDREILMFHEMSHCEHAVDADGEPRYTDEGLPVWRLVEHDVNEFIATVRRYGPYSAEIEEFVKAASDFANG
jgi:hypothetical protein